jgi:hypothetical protein
LSGTTLAYVLLYAPDSHTVVAYLFRDDALHQHRRKLIEKGDVDDVAAGPHGVVAFLTSGSPAYQLLLDRPVGPRLLVDQGLKLDRLRFSRSGWLVWRHGRLNVTTAVQRVDRCGNGEEGGTLDLAVTQTPTSLTTCWRATGRSRTLTADRVTHVAVAGAWAAVATADHRILAADTLSDAGVTIPDVDVAGLAIDAWGSIAWETSPDAPGRFGVWAHDSAGTRELDVADDETSFGFDGSTLRWGPKTAVLAP